MLCLSGEELKAYITEETEESWQKRDFLSHLDIYMNTKRRRVLGISGLRGTGKTVGLLQFLQDKDGAYILAQKNDGVTAEEYIECLRNIKENLIVLDEYSWIPDKQELDAYLYTLVSNGKKVIVTGTESIAIEALRYGELIHRIDIVDTNHFSYDEFCRMNQLPKNKVSCKQFLETSGTFPQYVAVNFESMRDYIKLAIIDNLVAKTKLDPEYAAAIIYTIFYKAVCDSTIRYVPVLQQNHLPVTHFLDKMGIDESICISATDFNEVSSILEQAGIIVTVPNYRVRSEYRTYVTNPALTYQLIMAVFDIKELPEYMYGSMFEAASVIHMSKYLMGDSFLTDKLYYLQGRKNGHDCEIDFLVEELSKHGKIYLFECKFSDGPVVKEKSSLVANTIEEIMGDKEIGGRYVVYNGQHNYDIANQKEVLYIGMDNLLSNFHQFSANKATIIQELKDQNRESYLAEKQKVLMAEKTTYTDPTQE